MISIVDYGIGNVASIANMLRKSGVAVEITGSPDSLRRAEKLVLPGVGAFDNGMLRLRERGLDEVLTDCVLGAKTPILGICLGMQLFSRGSEEGQERGLGWIDANCVRFAPSTAAPNLKVPHMGWNSVRVQASTFAPFVAPDARFYFVHSYHVRCDHEEDIAATSEYGGTFVAALQRGNIYGAQFHPEKSHRFGMHLLRSFAAV